MEEFKDDLSNESRKGAWMRPDLDEKPEIKAKSPYSGHVKDGIAHGLGTIRGKTHPIYSIEDFNTFDTKSVRPKIFKYIRSKKELKDKRYNLYFQLPVTESIPKEKS